MTQYMEKIKGRNAFHKMTFIQHSQIIIHQLNLNVGCIAFQCRL